jgi:hypothetical protein
MKATADTPGTLPTRPRFTLETLREIRIATGDGESTIAEYTYTHKGQTVKKYATFEDLTRPEREAALLFILKYSGAAAIRRKAKPRGRAVTGAGQKRTGRQPPPFDLDKIEFQEITPDSMKPVEFEPLEIDPAALLDSGGRKRRPKK